MIAFGPVPSRRLGRSLGINNVPPKVCSYACVYCQLGRAIEMQIERRWFYEPADILQEAQDKVEKTKARGESVDYLTFVPDGEPTLDVNLGREIELLKPLEVRIAVISNASLIWREDVREDLMKADWVSLKIDSTREEVWRKINRPYRALQLNTVLDGILEFSRNYAGQLVTETMLVAGINDGGEQLEEVADFLALVGPDTAFISIPTRPPAEKWVQPPSEEVLNRSYHLLSNKVKDVEYLIGYEGNAFASTGNIAEDLLSITSVHPMREDAVKELLTRSGADWSDVHNLIAQGQLVEAEYQGRKFYMRKLHKGHER